MRRALVFSIVAALWGLPAAAQEPPVPPCVPPPGEPPEEPRWHLALDPGANGAADVAFDPADPGRVLVAGTPSGPMAGGPFVSEDAGSSFSRGAGIAPQLRAFSVAFSHADPDVLFVGTDATSDDEGPVALYRSIDGGGLWCPVGRWSSATEALLTDPRVPDTVWAGLSSGKVMRSDDAGLTWTEGRGIPSATAVRGLAAGPTPDVLLAVTSAGVFRSTDGGLSWARSETGMERTLTGGSPVGYDVEPAGGAVVYAATGTGLHRSSDFGQTWQLIRVALTNVRDHAGGGCYGLSFGFNAFTITDTGVWVGAAACGLWASRDEGQSWTYLQEFPGSAAAYQVLRSAGSHVWAGTSAEGVYRSLDDAISFDVAAPGWADGSPVTLYTLGGGHVLGQSESRAFRSSDGGRTWRIIDDFHEGVLSDADAAGPLTSVVVANAGNEGFFRSTDAGASWDRILSLPRLGRATHDPFVSGAFFAVAGGLAFRSSDGGATWLPVGAFPGGTVNSLEASPHRAGLLVAGGTGAAWRSDDGGRTWAAAQGVSPTVEGGTSAATVTAIGFVPGQPDTVLLGASALYRSTDGGRTFSKVGGLPPNLAPQTLATQPGLPGLVYIGANKGLFRSADGGANITAPDESGIDVGGPRLAYPDPSDAGGFLVVAGPHAMWPFRSREAA